MPLNILFDADGKPKLNSEQLEYARKIGEKAKEMGVPPDFAIAIAFKESGLNPNVARGKDGEYGIMQIMPSTGKGLGFSNKDLMDPDKNIEAGVKYLKQHLDTFKGNLRLSTIAYNKGPGHEFFYSPDAELPLVTKDYLKKMKSYGVYDGQPTSQPVDQLVANTQAPSEEADGEEGDMALVENTTKPSATLGTSGASEGERFLGGTAGMGAGVLVAARQGSNAKKAADAVKLAGDIEAAREAARRAPVATPPTPPGAAPAAPGTPKPPLGSTIMKPGVTPSVVGLPTPMGVADAGRMAQGQTGVIPYNTAKALGVTDIEAGQALTNTKQAGGAWDIATKRADALNKLQGMGMGNFVENPMYGGIMTEAPSVGGGVRTVDGAPQSFTMKAPVAPNPDLPTGQPGGLSQLPPRQVVPTAPPPPAPPSMGMKTKAGLDWITGKFANMIRPVASAAGTVGRYASGPLGGLSVGLDVAEMANEYDKPKDQRDLYKMGLKGVSAASGLASMVPGPHQLATIPMSIGASAMQAYRDDPEYFNQKMQAVGRAFQPNSYADAPAP